MGRRGGPNKDRQLQLAKERGLTHLVKDFKEEVPHQVVRTRNPYPTYRRETEEPVKPTQFVRQPCPCEQDGHKTGRHKMIDGWCIEGRFWPFAAVAEMRKVEHFTNFGEEGMNNLRSKLEVLQDEIGLDLSLLKAKFLS